MKLALTIVATATLALIGSSAPKAGNPSVHGNFTRSNGTMMKLDAVVLKDGRVIGSMRSESSSGFIYTVAYDHVSFTSDGKGAYLHGFVTYANNNPALVGKPSIEKVVDNGEGANALADSTSPVINSTFFPTDPAGYEAYIDSFAQAGVIKGDIQVLAH